MTFNNLPVHKSRRQLMLEVPRDIHQFNGRIVLANGMRYPTEHVDAVMGHISGKQISNFMMLIDGVPRYKPRPETYPRLVALYCFVAIHWPRIARHIVK